MEPFELSGTVLYIDGELAARQLMSQIEYGLALEWQRIRQDRGPPPLGDTKGGDTHDRAV